MKGTTPRVTDKEVIDRVLSGEKEAFGILVKRYQGPIVNYVYRMTGDFETAIELSQEIFLKVFTSLGKFNGAFKFSPWLYKIAGNLTIDFHRKKGPRTVSLNQLSGDEEGVRTLDLPSGSPGPEEIYYSTDLRERIEEAMTLLPDEQREILILRHLNGLDYTEIAEAKNLPLGTVKNRLFRARRKLKEMIFPPNAAAGEHPENSPRGRPALTALTSP